MRTTLNNSGTTDSSELDQIRDWKALHRLSTQLLKTNSTTAKLAEVLASVVAFHHTSRAVISIHDPGLECLTVRASIGMTKQEVEELNRIKLSEGCSGAAFAERDRIVVENFDKDERFEAFHPWAKANHVGAVYSTPFYDDDTAIGVVTVYFGMPHTPTAREMELTDICAGTIALILGRELADASSRQERERRNKVLAHMDEGYIVLAHDFTVREMNHAAVRMCQRPIADMIGKSHWKVWPEVNDTEMGTMFRRAMSERIPLWIENRWVSPSGDVGWYEVHAQPIDEGMAIYFRDITRRKTAEQAVADSEARYRALAENTSEVVWRADATGMVCEMSPGWARFTGQTSAESSGEGWANAIQPDDRAGLLAEWHAAVATGMDYMTTYRMRRSDGQYRNMISHGVPLKDKDGHVREWIGLCQDVTALREAEEIARQENVHKDEFLAMLGHELRNPLSAVRMATDLLERTDFGPERTAHFARVINRQVAHMTRLVEDLMDISRISRGQVSLERNPVDLCAAITAAAEQLRPMMNAKQHRLTLDLPEEACIVFGDHVRLVQVAGNLIGNAARYTPAHGDITARLLIEAGKALFTVSDTGIGIEPALLPEIFNLYTQAKMTSDRQSSGLGMGLTLVKSLVELHGGTVTAMSDGPNMGSMFSVTLPCAATN